MEKGRLKAEVFVWEAVQSVGARNSLLELFWLKGEKRQIFMTESI